MPWILLYDPVNIRYALDSSNMSVWTMHNPTRYALILADGPAVMFEFDRAEHVNDGLPGVDEVRPAISWMYLTDGDLVDRRVAQWSAEIAGPVRGGRLAVDRLDPLGAATLAGHGVKVIDGQPLTERARSIKSDEIELMRWTIRVCEAGMARVYEASEPGRTERQMWAELHFENARSGGEWLETKLLTSGPRTNPWYQECSDRTVRRGEMIAFDTDMVGPYGYCADLSRSWTCGHEAMTAKQRELYAAAREQIDHNLALLRRGLDFVEFNQRSWRIPEKYVPFRYTLAVHGTGMADEWPFVYLHPDFDPGYGGRFKQNMVVNVESLIAESGSESVKLETQVLITTDGAERLDIFPWEDSSHQLQWIQEGGTSTVTTPEASLRRRPRPTRTCRLREVRSLAVAVRAVGMTRSRAIGKRAPPDGRAEWTSRERPEMCPMLRRSFVSAAREF